MQIKEQEAKKLILARAKELTKKTKTKIVQNRINYVVNKKGRPITNQEKEKIQHEVECFMSDLLWINLYYTYHILQN